MRGFTKIKMTDHELAQYLRKHNAIDNYGHVGKACIWRDANETCWAVVIYGGATARTIYLPNHLKG